jgi:hypothetical protein
MKRWIIGAVPAGAVAILLLFFLYKPAVQAGSENGAFANDCCGTIELRDGGMRLNDKQTVAYSVGSDARGPYILPRTYVGAIEDIGFEVDGTPPATKLRLDKLPAPSSILLYEGLKPHRFDRERRRAPMRPPRIAKVP